MQAGEQFHQFIVTIYDGDAHVSTYIWNHRAIAIIFHTVYVWEDIIGLGQFFEKVLVG